MPRLPAELADFVARYVAGPGAVRAALEGAGAAAMSRAGREGWSVRDVVVHLADAELIRGARLRLILGGEEPPALPAWEAETWKRRLQYLWRSPEAALALYDALVFSNAELLRQVDGRAFERCGMLEGREVTVRELLERGAAHSEEHAAQIRALRAELGDARAEGVRPERG